MKLYLFGTSVPKQDCLKNNTYSLIRYFIGK
jgi:hypothetical protein